MEFLYQNIFLKALSVTNRFKEELHYLYYYLHFLIIQVFLGSPKSDKRGH